MLIGMCEWTLDYQRTASEMGAAVAPLSGTTWFESTPRCVRLGNVINQMTRPTAEVHFQAEFGVAYGKLHTSM